MVRSGSRRFLAVRHVAADHPRVASAQLGLGELLLDTGRAGEAAPWIREAHAALETKLGASHPLTLRARAVRDRLASAE